MPRAHVVAGVGIVGEDEQLLEFAQRFVERMSEIAIELGEELGIEVLPLPEEDQDIIVH